MKNIRVQAELQTTPTEELDKAVAEELKKDDPDEKEKAEAIENATRND